MSDRRRPYVFPLVLLWSLWTWTSAHAEPPPTVTFPSCPALPGTAPGTTPPGQAPGAEAAAPTPDSTAAQQSEAGTQPSASYSPTMFGDFMPLVSGGQIVETLNIQTGRSNVANLNTANGVVTITPNSVIFTFPSGQRALPSALVGATFNVDIILPDGSILPAGQPLTRGKLLSSTVFAGPFTAVTAAGSASIVGAGAFKITENESPRPQDRVFLTYNYYNDANKEFAAFDLHRQIIGFEKTFLDGDASIGMRLPFFEVDGDDGMQQTDIGDLSVILKYAFYNDRDSGNLMSAGVVVTLPVGEQIKGASVPDIHPTLVQPFFGFIYVMGDAYLHGFSSLLVPFDSRDAVILFNDIALGYNLYRNPDRDSWFTSVTPTIEAHFNDPLTQRGSRHTPIGVADTIDLTAAVRLGLGCRSTLGLGVVTPVTGPRPFDVEAQVQFNYRF
jgi:hypothetical protein